MNKKDLALHIAAETGLAKSDAQKALEATLNAVTNALARGEEIRIVGFATFKVSHRSARVGRNPRTGEHIDIPATKVAKFKAHDGLKETINE